MAPCDDLALANPDWRDEVALLVVNNEQQWVVGARRLDSGPGYSVDSWSTTEECCLIEMGGGNRPCEARQPAVHWPQGAKSGRAICEIRERREDAPLPRLGCFVFFEPALPFLDEW